MQRLVDGFRVFSMKEMHEIHCAAMEIIEGCGLEVCHEELLRMAGDADIPVRVADRKIYPTEESVLETIRQMTGAAEPEVTEEGAQRPSLQRRIISSIATNIGSNHGFVVEPDGSSWRMRPTTREDLKSFIKLRRVLGCSEGGPGLIPQDVPAEVSPIHAAAISAKYSKAAGTPDCRDTSDMDWITRVMQASGRWDESREFKTYALVKSPLCLRGRDADIVLHQAREGWCTHIVGVPITAATSPCTLAGDIAQRLAETFGFMTFSRLITPPPNNQLRPGAFNSGFPEMDLRKGHLITATPRGRLYRIAWTQIQGEFYKMPGASGTGIDLPTDAAEPGLQACIEKALASMASVTRGIYTDSDEPQVGSAGLGTVVANLALSAEQAVLDNEIVHYLSKFLEGIRVDEDCLAVELIKEVGSEADFASTDHAVRHAKRVSWHSDLFHRGPFDAWTGTGRRDPLDLAKEKVREAMELELPLMIPEDRARDVDRVVGEAEGALLG